MGHRVNEEIIMYAPPPEQPIHIKKANEGKFTAWAKNNGFSSVQAAAMHVMANKTKYTPEVVKMANFACNAKSWK
jgi:hypothetical protein